MSTILYRYYDAIEIFDVAPQGLVSNIVYTLDLFGSGIADGREGQGARELLCGIG